MNCKFNQVVERGMVADPRQAALALATLAYGSVTV